MWFSFISVKFEFHYNNFYTIVCYFISLFHVIVQKLESKELQTSLDNWLALSDTPLESNSN